jgi:putative peptide zinc metalloprotease protein
MPDLARASTLPAYVLSKNVTIGPEQYINGNVMRFMKRRGSQGYWRTKNKEAFILSLLDGNTTLEEISERYYAEFKKVVSTEALAQAIEAFARQGLLDRADTGSEPAAGDGARVTATVPKTPPSLFNLKILSWNPDEYLARIAPPWRWLSNGWVLVAWGLLIVVAELLVLQHLPGIWYVVAHAPASTILARVLLLAVILSVGFTLHEGGHAIVCKSYGGEVREMGFLLRYFLFTPYTNVDDIVLFPRRRSRLCVLMVGPLISLTMIPLALLVWLSTPAGGLAHLVSADVLVWYNAATLLQLIPFVQTDGYFALAQMLRMPDLMKDSYMFLLGAVFSRAGGRKMTVSGECPAYVKPTYVAFGLLSVAATAFVVVYAIRSYEGMLAHAVGDVAAIAVIAVLLAGLIVRFGSQLSRWSRARAQ